MEHLYGVDIGEHWAGGGGCWWSTIGGCGGGGGHHWWIRAPLVVVHPEQQSVAFLPLNLWQVRISLLQKKYWEKFPLLQITR